MKKNELENRLSEVEEVSTTIEKTLQVALDEVKRAEVVKDEASRILNEVSNFARASLENLLKIEEEDRAKAFEEVLKRLVGWSQAEGERMRTRPQVLQERVTALQSITNWLGERGSSHKARIAAIERAADPNRDKKHPEKLSVRRAAQELLEDSGDDE